VFAAPLFDISLSICLRCIILFVLGQLKFHIYLLPFQFQRSVANTIYQHKCHKIHFAAINFNYKPLPLSLYLCLGQAIRNMQIELHNALPIFGATGIPCLSAMK